MGQQLMEIIHQEIREKGPIPFARYQELCLYYPGLGYYQKGDSPTGRSGDFYTAPHVHELFGRTIGQWIRNSFSEDLPATMTIVELGPGNGQLAQDILDSWPGTFPENTFLEYILSEYILVEGGDERRKQLEERFAGKPVRVIPPDKFNDLKPFQGVVLANEFFDALPMTIYERCDDELLELWVDLADDQLVELLRPATRVGPIESAFLDKLTDGCRTELADGWGDWLSKISSKLEVGALLTFDYGDPADGLLVPWRGGGTLRCFRSHKVDTEPFEAPGEKDITAHVNFTVLEELAREAGLTPDRLRSQASFLIRGGILELLEAEMAKLDEKEATSMWLTVKNLVHDEEGMGEVFKTAVFKKNME